MPSAALQRCDELIKFYGKSQLSAGRWYHFFKTIAIASTVAAPLVVVFYPTDTTLAKALVAVVAALGGLCSGVLSLFNWHEVWVRHAQAADAFSAEENLFVSSASVYKDKANAESNFAERVEKIQGDVVAKWVKTENPIDIHLNPPKPPSAGT